MNLLIDLETVLVVEVRNGVFEEYNRQDIKEMIRDFESFKCADNLPKWLFTNGKGNRWIDVVTFLIKIVKYPSVYCLYLPNFDCKRAIKVWNNRK